LTIGTGSNKLLDIAALARLVLVGWSGIMARKMYRWSSFLSLLGRRLKRWAPCIPKGPFPCRLHLTRGHCGLSLPVTPLPHGIITSDQPLVLLPEETDLVVLTPSFLRVYSQERQLFPVAQLCPFYLRDILFLHSLYPVDRCLIPRGPNLAAIVQPWLDQTSENGEHQLASSSPKSPKSPACHPVPRLNDHVNLDLESKSGTISHIYSNSTSIPCLMRLSL
jgi:hypothetical protein